MVDKMAGLRAADSAVHWGKRSAVQLADRKAVMKVLQTVVSLVASKAGWLAFRKAEPTAAWMVGMKGAHSVE